jgi:hypothetical protein
VTTLHRLWDRLRRVTHALLMKLVGHHFGQAAPTGASLPPARTQGEA